MQIKNVYRLFYRPDRKPHPKAQFEAVIAPDGVRDADELLDLLARNRTVSMVRLRTETSPCGTYRNVTHRYRHMCHADDFMTADAATIEYRDPAAAAQVV